MERKETYGKRSKPSGDRTRKVRKVKEELNFSQTVYGIGVFEMTDATTLEDEEHWRSELEFCEMYYPVYASSHRNTVFLLYGDQLTRDKIFSCENLQKINNVVVTKVCFEINPGEQPSQVVETFLRSLGSLLTSPIIDQGQRLWIKNESMNTISKCYKLLKESSLTLLNTMDPDPDTLQWFLICELLLFFIYKITEIDHDYLTKLIRGFSDLGWNIFNEKLKSLNQVTRVFVIDTLWQEIFYFKEKNRGIWLENHSLSLK